MDSSIFSTFSASFLAIGEIFILMGIGFFTVRKGIIKSAFIQHLSELLVYVTLPLMIFSRIVMGFSFREFKLWWIFPLAAVLMIFVPFILAGLTTKLLRIRENLLEFKSLVSFQNSAYLPLALVSALLKPEEANAAILYILFFLMGFNFLIWSWGVAMLKSKDKNEKVFLIKFLSPPFIATLVAVFLVAIGINKFIPEVVTRPLKMLGDSTVPLGLFLVGAALAEFKINRKTEKGIYIAALLKLIIVPLVFLGILRFFSLPNIASLVLLLQAAMPSATSLLVIARVYGENSGYISQGILITHLFAFLTIPLFLFLFFRLF